MSAAFVDDASNYTSNAGDWDVVQMPKVPEDATKINSKQLFNLIRYNTTEQTLKFIESIASSRNLREILSAVVRMYENTQIALFSSSAEDEAPSSGVPQYTMLRSHSDYTPLAVAARLRKDAVAARLVVLDENVSAGDNIALRWAIKNNNFSLTQAIINHPTFLVPRRAHGLIRTCAENGGTDILKLLRAEFNTSFTASLLTDAIKAASQRNHKDTIEYLTTLTPYVRH